MNRVLTEREVVRSSRGSSINLHGLYSVIHGCTHAPTATVHGPRNTCICALCYVKHAMPWGVVMPT